MLVSSNVGLQFSSVMIVSSTVGLLLSVIMGYSSTMAAPSNVNCALSRVGGIVCTAAGTERARERERGMAKRAPIVRQPRVPSVAQAFDGVAKEKLQVAALVPSCPKQPAAPRPPWDAEPLRLARLTCKTRYRRK